MKISCKTHNNNTYNYKINIYDDDDGDDNENNLYDNYVSRLTMLSTIFACFSWTNMSSIIHNPISSMLFLGIDLSICLCGSNIVLYFLPRKIRFIYPMLLLSSAIIYVQYQYSS